MKKKVYYEVRLRGTSIVLKSFEDIKTADSYSNNYNKSRNIGDFASYVTMVKI